MEGEQAPAEGQMRMKWESLQQEVSAKQRLLRDALAQEQEQVVLHVLSYVFTLVEDAQRG